MSGRDECVRVKEIEPISSVYRHIFTRGARRVDSQRYQAFEVLFLILAFIHENNRGARTFTTCVCAGYKVRM